MRLRWSQPHKGRANPGVVVTPGFAFYLECIPEQAQPLTAYAVRGCFLRKGRGIKEMEYICLSACAVVVPFVVSIEYTPNMNLK